MHNRHGILAQSYIDTVRRALKNKLQEDQEIQDLIEELGQDYEVTPDEMMIMDKAFIEVRTRLHYTALLDSLWAQIEEVQRELAQLHVYESLETTMLQESAENTEDVNIDFRTVALDDVDDSWMAGWADDVTSSEPMNVVKIAADDEDAVVDEDDATVHEDGAREQRLSKKELKKKARKFEKKAEKALRKAMKATAKADKKLQKKAKKSAEKALCEDKKGKKKIKKCTCGKGKTVLI